MLKSLQARLLAFVVVLLAGAVFAVGVLSYQQLRSQLLDGVERDARSATTGYAFAVATWLEARTGMIASLRPVVGRPEAAEYYARYAEAGGFDLVYAGSPDKRMVFSKPQKVPEGYDPTQRPWYQGAEAAGPNKVFVSKPYVDAFTGALIMSLSSVVQENGKTRGVVANDMSIAQVVKEILSVRLPGEGFAFILHKDGTVLVHPNKDAVLKPVTSIIAELTPERIARAASDGRMFTAVRADGERFMLLSPVKDSDWILGVSLSKEIVLQPLQRLLLTLAGALLVVVLIAAALAGTITRTMLAGLRQIRDRMQDIAKGGGDLSVRLQISSDDEIGQTARAFNHFLEQLGGMFGSLRDEANRLAEGVQRLNAVIDTIASESMQLSETASANAAAIEEITVAVSHIADNAHDVDRMMRDTEELSRQSVSDVVGVARDAESSGRQVEDLAEILNSLDSRSQEISGIVNVIKGIADQTNLLALNAAIEAARAGEQGRGFAVVADEVRKLAESTAKATIEIAQMIESVRAQTAQAGTSMTTTVGTVRRGVDLSRAAAERIAEIEQKIQLAVERVGDIALSTNEQKGATTSMAQSTEQINNRVMSEDEALQLARRELTQLAERAGKTRELLSGFKL